jgi:hypothetical protein
VTVRSAGSAPADTVNPAVVQVMAEIGLDTAHEFPKLLTDEGVQAADVVITMGCGDACPVYPGKRYLNWELDDPAGKTVEQIRPIRDDIDRRVTRTARRTRAGTQLSRSRSSPGIPVPATASIGNPTRPAQSSRCSGPTGAGVRVPWPSGHARAGGHLPDGGAQINWRQDRHVITMWDFTIEID